MTKLTDLCDIQYGYAFDSGAFTDDESYPQLVRIRDVKRGYSETYYNGEYPEEYVLSAGDLLIGMDGEFNIARWKVDGALLNQRVCKIIAKDNADEEFLRFALLKALKAIEDRTSFATVKHLSAKELNKLEIPVPPYEEQKKISEILHGLEKVIDIRQNELASLDELIKARFVELFGNGHDGVCKTERLGDFCKFQQGTQVPVEDQIEEKKEGYTRFLRIVDYTQAPQEPRYVSVKGREITKDSVVIVRYGATAGFVGHGYSGILANNLFEVVPDEAVLSKDFLYLALKYGSFEKEVHDKAFGAAMPALSFGMMNDIGVVTPDSSEQSGFVGFVKQVDKSKVAVQKALNEAQLLFDSLMQEYFG